MHPSSAERICLIFLILESGQSVYLISLDVSIHGRQQASIGTIFRQSAGYVKICSHILLFLRSIWSRYFGHAETGSEAKKRVVLWHEIFPLILK